MKKTLMAMAMFAASVCGFAQHRADQQHLEDENSFSMIVLGDPQGYIKYDINQPLFDLCTAWIADNIDNLNIKAVLCTGDLVEQNDNITMNRNMLNQTSREMWEAGSRCFERLDNKVPYFISGGNHEYGYRHSENGMTHFPEYFPFERNRAWRDIIVSDYPNRQGITDIENAAFEFDEPNWGKILVIVTEFAPRDEVLEWAKDLCASDKYKDHKVIFMTHSLLRERSAEYTDNESYKITPRNWGKQVWEKLIYPSSNIVFALCGHTGHPGDYEDSIAYRVDKNASGRNVHQMMFNVQILGGGWEGNGGDGWLRILEFMPDGKTVKVKTYSPLFGISALTKHLAHRDAPYDQFDMVIE
ncbi:MAG: metallophosphoesterase [Muribaculaceae bacterium]|nr:metallophosphoesterase [Muribaculaceae bacterium]